MSELVRGPNGEYGIWSPDAGVKIISQAEYEQREKGRFGRFAGALGDSLRDTAGYLTGVASIYGGDALQAVNERRQAAGLPERSIPLANQSAELQFGNDERQAARSAVDPLMSTAGGAAGLALEMAVPGQQIGAGARNLTRRVMGRGPAPVSPRSPGAVPERGMGSPAERGQAIGEAVVDRSIGAAQRAGPQRNGGRSSLLSADEAYNRGMPLTRAEKKYLQAMDSGDMAAIEAAETGLANQDFLRNTQLMGDTNAGDFMWRNRDKEQFFTEQVADELGRPDLARLNASSINEIRDDASKIFKEAFESGDFPVNKVFEMSDGEGGTMFVDIMGQARKVRDSFARGQAPEGLERVLDQLENAIEKGKVGGTSVFLDPKALQEARKIATDNASAAFDAGRYDTGQAISSVGSMIDDALEAALPEQLRLEVGLARRRWKIKKVLERTARSTSRTEVGQINPATFRNNWRAMTPGYRRHFRPNSEFERMMDTVDTLAADRAHAGSTLYRAVGPAAKGAAVTIGGGALAGAGFGLMQ